MSLFPINITGQSYQSRSRPLSNQLTQGFYADAVDNQSAKSDFVLLPFPGMKQFSTETLDGKDRGILEHKSIAYRVAGEKLYSVDKTGVHTELGDVPGVDRCILQGINDNVVIVTSGKAYQYNGTTVTEITDNDLESPNSCAHLNNQMIFDGDGGRFVSSNVGDATTIDGLNYASAESDADDLKRVYAFGGLLYLFGDKTTEIWQNTGVGSPPFDPLKGAEITVGIAAIHSASNNDNFLYFLADDNHVYRIQGTSEQRITSTAMHSQISAFVQTFDAIGDCFTLEGHNFYKLTFPGQARTFLFSEQTGWFNLASGKNSDRHYSNSYMYAFRKHLVTDYRNNNSNLYELDINTYTDNLDPIVRIRDTGPLHGGLFGKPGKRLTMNYFELIMDTGVGVISGQGSDPEIMLCYSDDGGRTFGNEIRGKIGKLGEYQTQVRWNVLGSFYERVLRIKISDPVFCAIHGAAADIEVGI